jgi:intermediate cleaving peptidase 55
MAQTKTRQNGTAQGVTTYITHFNYVCSLYASYSTSVEDAAALFKANLAMHISSFPSQLKSLISLSSYIYLDLPVSATPRSSKSRPKSILKYLTGSVPARTEYDSIVEALSGSRRKPLAPEVGKLRAFKSKCEQDIMRAAADISGTAHAKVRMSNNKKCI